MACSSRANTALSCQSRSISSDTSRPGLPPATVISRIASPARPRQSFYDLAGPASAGSTRVGVSKALAGDVLAVYPASIDLVYGRRAPRSTAQSASNRTSARSASKKSRNGGRSSRRVTQAFELLVDPPGPKSGGVINQRVPGLEARVMDREMIA